MSNIAVRAEGLSKRYQLSVGMRPQYETFSDKLSGWFRLPSTRRSQAARDAEEARTLWALQDVSFEIKNDEAVGIIGRNGAGKSTLLKVLSQITEPTRGRAHVYGKVRSLLEVGTGFHPELTGRENIFLNGAILGMRRREIARKFDEIVEFSEIERFIDTPAKYYSSGMYMRLAFAVAAYLEPDILIVDEVLAVGDASFQKKCLNKMQDVGQSGRTVLFVSHNMSAITRLCQRAILLNNGQVLADGPSHQVVSQYLHSGLGSTAMREWADPIRAPGNNVTRLYAVRVRDDDMKVSEAIDIRRPVHIEMEYEVLEPGHVLVPNYHFYNEEGICAFILHDLDPEWRGRPRPVGRYVTRAELPGNFLAEGTMMVQVAMSTHDPVRVHFDVRDAVAFQVVDSLDGDSARGDYAGPMPGIVRPMVPWVTDFQGTSEFQPSLDV